MAKITQPAFAIKITLRDSQPAIWRRFIVPCNVKLAQLHDIIQIVMGWNNSHKHVFSVGEVQFATPYERGDLEELTAIDDRQVRLFHLVSPHRSPMSDFHFAMEYEYDTGDKWIHDLIFEDVLDPDPHRTMPLCLAGERACPPEDCGGVHGYKTLLEAVNDPNHPEHGMYAGWLGRKFDPEKFNVNDVNIALHTPSR